MPTDTKMLRCENCEKITMHFQQRWGSIVHLILTLLTGGVWLLFWMSGTGKDKPECNTCGWQK